MGQNGVKWEVCNLTKGHGVKREKPEIMAPAGDWPSMMAAVGAGCDAAAGEQAGTVYLRWSRVYQITQSHNSAFQSGFFGHRGQTVAAWSRPDFGAGKIAASTFSASSQQAESEPI